MIAYIAPAYRNDAGAAEFAEILANELTWAPEDFGAEYAWNAPIPDAIRMRDEAHSLAAHLANLA